MLAVCEAVHVTSYDAKAKTDMSLLDSVTTVQYSHAYFSPS